MILLNDILKLDNLENVKIRFNLMFNQNWNPIEIFKNKDFKTALNGQYWNYKKNRSFKSGQTTIGFIKINKNDDLWLLFHVGKITKDLNVLDGVGYEYEILSEYEKYFGRLIIKFKNKSQTMIRLANSVINECEVVQILPDTFDNDFFPGYDKVNVTWPELSRVINNETWKTALKNQKGVYLITDTFNGKMYVGSAYGEHMILGRWQAYIKTGNGDNKDLKKLSFDYIKKNFKYSILDIFKSTIDDLIIIERESWWKEVLKTREFGYNNN
ncbi:GIY-YIG nuclease family protein [Roseimarinus sediminis]|uniref:GIY-YIG nuclease family protein n=1 Tax=Roseimarinus sediminis TaxID=1610899 RepID=UPI003D25F0E5